MLPAYQNLVATHPSIRSRASQELGLGASAGKAVAGQSELCAWEQAGTGQKLCRGAWQRPPSQGLP